MRDRTRETVTSLCGEVERQKLSALSRNRLDTSWGRRVAGTVFGAMVLALTISTAYPADHDWSSYLGDPGRSHFSQLKEINVRNVQRLATAWTYHSGDAGADNFSQIQCNPL